MDGTHGVAIGDTTTGTMPIIGATIMATITDGTILGTTDTTVGITAHTTDITPASPG